MRTLQVVAHRSWDTVEPLRAEVDALDRASRRPCPFATFEYLRTLDAHDEYRRHGDELLFLAALEGPRLVGYLPLRRRRERVLGAWRTRVGVLADHDTDRPHVVAAAEDEARCCEAFYRHLVEREPGWTFLELLFQDAASGLDRPPALPATRFHVRRFENMPNSTIPLERPSLREHFASMPASFRRVVRRYARAALRSGRAEVVWSDDPSARLALLELYLDLERRSWKAAAGAGVTRHASRVAFFRELCQPWQPLALHFLFVLLDGVPIAGVLGGTFEGSDFGLETTFDDGYLDLAPGHLVLLMALHRAQARGLRSLNLDGNYAYYKARWGAEVTATRAVQIYRVPSLHWLKARAGALRRRLRPPEAQPDLANPERQRAAGRAAPGAGGAEAAAPDGRPDRSASRARADAALAALEAAGASVSRLAGPALEASLPFPLRTAGGLD
jgi:CelD/BcsL family acetyltransferase involved in cellulose biosynthesis